MCSVIICTQSSQAPPVPRRTRAPRGRGRIPAAAARPSTPSGVKPRAALTSSSRFSTRAFAAIAPFPSCSARSGRCPAARDPPARAAAGSLISCASRSMSAMKPCSGRASAFRPERRRRCSAGRRASHSESPAPLACSRIASRLFAPMPRVGRFTTRSKEASSRRLEIRRRYASASLISARSKNRRPPYTL